MLLLSAGLYVKPAAALMNQPDEASLRAAVIVGILRYTKIPIKAATNEIRLCSVGKPYSENKLQQVSASLRVQQNTLNFSVMDNSDVSLQAINLCDVLIIGGAYNPSKALLADYSGLSICDTCTELKSSYVVELIKADKRIGFNVNLFLADSRKVSFSSSLLELASNIIRSEQ
ncbi:YfiR family protein [Catenovulum agarivorans]|nr:YfiR family protein [Catenovulum agarivorans]